MKIKVSEISKILQKRIDNYQFQPQDERQGKVISVSDGVALVQGLKDIQFLEMVVFASGALGLTFSLEEHHIGVIILNQNNTIKENDSVQRTKEIISTPVGENFLGRVIDPLGNPLDSQVKISPRKKAFIEQEAPSIMQRVAVNQPLETGILGIDAILPIGKGQRELLIGDRQTGKTTTAIDTIINQKDKGVICIYVAIGQKNSSVLNIINKLKKTDALAHTLIVNASAASSDSMCFIAPFVGMTHAEFFLFQGKDVLIVFDDLSKHAVAYRSLSLLLNRNPGRQAYPGDIFYLHSRLLERAVKLHSDFGGGSITALPIIETQLEDLTAYIPTNVISITDGQIFFLNELFNLGFKPAIDFGLSVSRVGSAAQKDLIKKTARSLKLDIAKFKELKVFSQFGGSLDADTIEILSHGGKIMEFLKQKEKELIPQWLMVIILLVIQERLIDKLDLVHIVAFKKTLIKSFLIHKNQSWMQNLVQNTLMNHQEKKRILQECKKIINKFSLSTKGYPKPKNENQY